MKGMMVADMILSNLSIIFTFSFFMFRILDWYNPLMGFMANAAASPLFILFCIAVIGATVLHVGLCLLMMRDRAHG